MPVPTCIAAIHCRQTLPNHPLTQQTAAKKHPNQTDASNLFNATVNALLGLFGAKVPSFAVTTMDFSDYIKSKLLQFVYANDRYVIFKITNQ